MTAAGIAGGSQSAVKEESSITTSEGACATTALLPTCEDDNTESTYHLKWIPWNSGKIPIVMQSRNGPCPLIATMNVLLLREKVKLPAMLEQITATQLLTYLGECIMDSVLPTELSNDEDAILNLEQNIHDAIEILPKLKNGLDVNIRFTGITDFEYTPECIIFDLLRIPLFHGWLIDPDLSELQNAIGNQSYNQLVDNIITNKTSTDPEAMAKVLFAEDFLTQTASQLTLHGLNELKKTIRDNEIGILFRNNHFLTLFKREGEIYTLVTDHGYLTEDNIIWEILDNIEGAGNFYDSSFLPCEVTNRQVSEFSAIDQRQQQLENDFLMALSIQEEESNGKHELVPYESQEDDRKEGAASKLDDQKCAKILQEETHTRSPIPIAERERNSPTNPRLVALEQKFNAVFNSAGISEEYTTQPKEYSTISSDLPANKEFAAKESFSDIQQAQYSGQQHCAETLPSSEINPHEVPVKISSGASLKYGSLVSDQQQQVGPLDNKLPVQDDDNQPPNQQPVYPLTDTPSSVRTPLKVEPTGNVTTVVPPQHPQATSSSSTTSSSSRRSKSERSTKDSNCIVN